MATNKTKKVFYIFYADIICVDIIIRTFDYACSCYYRDQERAVYVYCKVKITYDWKQEPFAMLNRNLSAEIIYQGGGNAIAAFKNDATFQKITEAFLTETIRKATGVGIAVVAIETDFGDTYKTDFEKLNKRLTLVKEGFNIPVSAGSQPVTKQSGRTSRLSVYLKTYSCSAIKCYYVLPECKQP